MKHKFTFIAIIAVLLVVCSIVSVGCKDKGATPLDPVNGDSIQYDGETLSWDAVEGATSYKVSIEGAEYEIGEGATSMSLDRSDNFSVSILACANNEEHCNAETNGIADFTYLPKVEEVFVSDRASLSGLYHFNWNAPSSNVEYYETDFNGVKAKYDASSSLAFPIGEDASGKCTFRVKPASTVKNTYSKWTEKVVTVLETPHDFAYDPDHHLITWEASGATSFKVSEDDNLSLDTVDINGNAFKNQNANPDPNEPHTWVYLESPENFSLTVVSMGDLSQDILSSRAAVRKFTKLDDVDNLRVEYSTVSWVPNANATHYNVRVSEEKSENEAIIHEVTTVTVPYYDGLQEIYAKTYTREDGTLLPLEERQSVQYKVAVRPEISSVEESDIVSYSSWEEVLVAMISAPEIRWSGDSVSWDPVPSASGYSVRLTYKEKVQLISLDGNDKLIWSFNQDNSTQSGEYSVCVYANYNTNQASDANNRQGSNASNSIKIIVLPAPERYTVISNSDALAYGFASEGSTGRTDPSKEYSGASAGFANPELQFYFNTVDYATYYEVSHRYDGQYIGQEEDESVDFQENKELGTINITKSSDDNWDKYFSINTLISGASGRKDTLYIYARVDEEKSYDAENGVVVLNSNFSQAIEITKLATPSDIRIGADGMLTWNAVNQNSGYKIYIKCLESGVADHDPSSLSQVYTVYDTTFDVTNKITQPGRYQVYVAALGNNNIIISSNYSNALTVVKLATPTNSRVEKEDSNLAVVWDYDPFEVDDYTYNPTAYQIAIGDHIETISKDNNTLANHFNVDDYAQFIPASSPVRFVVRAVGDILAKDNVYVLDSEYSKTITLKRLDDPSTVEANSECVSWGRIDHADLYEVYDGEERIALIEQGTFRHNLTEDYYAKDNGNQISHSFRIRGIRDNYLDEETKDEDIRQYYIDSNFSNALNVRRLATPKVVVDQNTGHMSWSRVPLAVNYQVAIKVYDLDEKLVDKYSNTYLVFTNDEITDGVAAERGTISDYNPAIFGMNGYTAIVEVSAIGDEETTLSSFAYRYSLRMEKLKTPSNDCFEISAVNLKNGVEAEDGYRYFRITINKDGEFDNLGYGYNVNIGGVDYFVAKDANGVAVLDVPASYAGNFEVKICAAGDNYGSVVNKGSTDLVYYLDSDYTSAKTIRVIAASSYDNVTLDQTAESGKYHISFDTAKDVEYKITYSFQTATVKWVEVDGVMKAEVTHDEVSGGQTLIITASGEKSSIDITVPENAYWVSVIIEVQSQPENLIIAGQVTTKTFTVNN